MKRIIYALLLMFGIVLNIDIVKAEAVEVDTFEELKEAIINENEEITIIADFEFAEKLTITKDLKLNGNNKVLTRNSEYKGNFITISEGVTLSINDLTIDGSAPGWKMDYDNYYYTGANNTGYVRVPTINADTDVVASASLISNSGTLNLDNITIKNARSTVSGAGIVGAGNNNISNSNFAHIGSSKGGGAIFLSGGTTKVSNSKFYDNVAGVGETTQQNGGAIYANNATLIEVSGNTLFESNFAQGNAAAIMVNHSSFYVKDTNFIDNRVGNDGAAIQLNSTKAATTAYFENILFEKNVGYANPSQSMGIIWIDTWTGATAENPIVFKNIKAYNNKTAAGVIADRNKIYVVMENIDFSNNEIVYGAGIYAQKGNYKITNATFNNNKTDASGAIHMRNEVVSVELDNVTISGNNASVLGGAISLPKGGNLTIKNSSIYDNNSVGAGTIYAVSSSYQTPANIVIENTKIYSNDAGSYGGGIYIKDSANVYTSLVIDDSSKIYDNKAGVAGDDFAYVREDSGTETDNTITLNNASLMGIIGIDGLYHDNENDRFLTTENPTTFENYIGYNDGSIYLKAAGVSELNYDLNGGQSDYNYMPVEIRYGEDFILVSDVPNKSNGDEFIGWNTKEDGTGTWLYAGDKYDGSEGFLLYAQYKAVEENPNTSDNIIKYVILALLSIVSMLIVSIKLNVKKAHN